MSKEMPKALVVYAAQSSPAPATPDTFTLFPKLPLELRNIIWLFALPPSRHVKFRNRRILQDLVESSVCYDNIRLNASTKIPTILSVCSESRAVALVHYPLHLHNILGGFPLSIDYETDIFEISGEDSTQTLFVLIEMAGHFKRTGDREIMHLKENIHYLVLGGVFWAEDTVAFLVELKSLEKLVLKIPDHFRYVTAVEHLESSFKSLAMNKIKVIWEQKRGEEALPQIEFVFPGSGATLLT
ncbi:uncharacterized protein PAC_02513 [Phialocephala subalpina]|uniref:2EXR domain-containing protein n=1 Tax=Phialocephala subalpina TaxID=576137 RepID=A0A1L7WIQ1_9HELO|nr:uncharacterized protein PAC_02513 [Phialocephala subalpina]